MHASLDSLDADVVVVGAGLCGAMLTQRLVSAGAHVLLLEADDVGASASRRRLMLDPGISGQFDPERSGVVRALLGELSAAAPRLVKPLRVRTGTAGGWARRRALAALVAHDRVHPDSTPASAELADGDAILLTAHALEETRLALAYALDARRRGAEVRIGTRVTSLRRAESPGAGIVLGVRSETGTSTMTARIVVLAVGSALERLLPELAPSSEAVHMLELIVARSTAVARVGLDASGQTHLEQVRFGMHSLLRAWGPQPPELGEMLAAFEGRAPGEDSLEVLDLRRASWPSGPSALVPSSIPDVWAITGSELESWPSVLAELLQRLAPREPSVDTVEAPDFEITAAIERTRLGAPLLSLLSTRHGGRGARIAERVMAVPREGAVVCPCSTVTEAEIRYAHREELAADLAAICRRTELGLGACAGLRCALAAAQVLASETLASGSGDDGLVSHVASLHRTFLSERRAASVLEPERRASLDELARGMLVASGSPLEEAE